MKLVAKTFIKIIDLILYVIDKDYRVKEEIACDDTRKFTDVVDVDFESDFGRAKRVMRTVPYDVWRLKTNTYELLAADKHRVIMEDGRSLWMQDLKIGDRVRTKSGIEEVTEVKYLGFRTHMYDAEIDRDPHHLYTNGILSHNSTTAAAYILWTVMFNSDKTVLIVANQLNQALEIMQRIRYAYEDLPDWLRAGQVTYNKGSLEFDNNSRIVSRATTRTSGRGLSISLLYADEFAFVDRNAQEEFWSAIQPTLSEGGRLIITSTPSSDEDLFATMWRGAEDNTDPETGQYYRGGVGRNGFKAVKVLYNRHPNRDEEWAEAQKVKLGEEAFRREILCEFISAEETLVSSTVLSLLEPSLPLKVEGKVQWFKPIEPNKIYLVGLDPSMGIGKDFSVIQVFSVPEMEQVAEYRDNKAPIRRQINVLYELLKVIYQTMRSNPIQIAEPELYWSIENNILGEASLQVLTDTGEEYFPGMIINEPKRSGLHIRYRRGLQTSHKTKLAACSKLKSLMERGCMKINSKQLVSEIKNFVAKGNSYEGAPGSYDDCVDATLIICRMLLIMQQWQDEGFIDTLKEGLELDDTMEIEPLPIII